MGARVIWFIVTAVILAIIIGTLVYNMFCERYREHRYAPFPIHLANDRGLGFFRNIRRGRRHLHNDIESFGADVLELKLTSDNEHFVIGSQSPSISLSQGSVEPMISTAELELSSSSDDNSLDGALSWSTTPLAIRQMPLHEIGPL